MQVMYQSTRGKGEPVTASQAILKGLSEDGGLFVPTQIPAAAFLLTLQKKSCALVSTEHMTRSLTQM